MRLEEVVRALAGMPPAQRAQLEEEALQKTADLLWVPNPGPQFEAYYSLADELFYGGEAGGGKSELVLGLAYNCHRNSLILREFKDDARALGDRLTQVLGSTDGWNDQLARWRGRDKLIQFDGLPNEKDKEHHKGKPRDLYAFDEIGDFYESQYDFIIAWNRSTVPGQRCRVVGTGNPPTRAKGLWVIRRWGAWLDPKHPRPAKDGELRWYLRVQNGEEKEVEGPGPYEVDGKPTLAKSRTFIRAKLADNPDLERSGYDSTLARLPKELRDAYREGKFDASLKDHPFQVIPTEWVRDAQARWTPRPPDGVPMCAIGVDPVGGGKDRLAMAPRYDGYYAQLVCVPGKEIKLGSQIAGHVIANRRDNADIVLDMGGGYGGGCYQTLVENKIEVQVYKGANRATKRTRDGKLGFYNKRAETYWLFREALDPDQVGGSPIALPEDPELLGDLTAATYEVSPRGIQILDKEEVCKQLGRSPDKGDAVVMAWASGARGHITHSSEWRAEQRINRGSKPSVDLGPRFRNRRR